MSLSDAVSLLGMVVAVWIFSQWRKQRFIDNRATAATKLWVAAYRLAREISDLGGRIRDAGVPKLSGRLFIRNAWVSGGAQDIDAASNELRNARAEALILFSSEELDRVDAIWMCRGQIADVIEALQNGTAGTREQLLLERLDEELERSLQVLINSLAPHATHSMKKSLKQPVALAARIAAENVPSLTETPSIDGGGFQTGGGIGRRAERESITQGAHETPKA